MAEERQPSQAQALATNTAQHALHSGLGQLAGKVLASAGSILGAKGAAIVAVVVLIVVLIICLLALLVSAIGAAFQTTTAPWPVKPVLQPDGSYRAGGWAISSRFGWRENVATGELEFHDGIDIVNPHGGCPFGLGCPLPGVFDGVVEYVGWDQSGSADPSTEGGGQMVIIKNGENEHEVLYAHLQPYRLYIQLQGKIRDDYGRYDEYAEYQAIGDGELTPDLEDSSITMWCANDMPGFHPTRTGPGSVLFTYDRPAQCRTTVIWGERGDGWEGWIADQPGADANRQATMAWETPLESGIRAGDVALRFRAHLVPPPPPPTPTPELVLTPVAQPDIAHTFASQPLQSAVFETGIGSTGAGWNEPGSHGGQPQACVSEGQGMRCTWLLSDIPLASERQAFVSYSGASIPAAQTQPTGEDGTSSPEPSPALVVQVNQSQEQVPIGGRVSVAVAVFNDVQQAAPITVQFAADQELHVLDASTNLGECQVSGQSASCTLTPRYATPATVHLIAEIRSGTAPGSQLAIQITVSGSGQEVIDQAEVVVTNQEVTPGPWPPPTAAPLPTATPWLPYPAPIGQPPVTIQPTIPAAGNGPGDTLLCAPEGLVQLPNVVNAHGQTNGMQLVAPAATSFQQIRAEIIAQTSQDPLARLADALRRPEFRTDRPGVADRSWHKAGRAIDLNIGYDWRRVPDGSLQRLYLGMVDITAIFERQGWKRIPPQEGVAEWWHYEYHPDRIAWTSAMLQVWPIHTLQQAFPTIVWTTIGCQQDDSGDLPIPLIDVEACVADQPTFASAHEEVRGCGPPVRAGDRVYQLDSTLGFVGLTGRTTGAHLHLGLKVTGYDGMVSQVNVCTPAWLQGRIQPTDANCWTDMADPLAFLPLAPAPHESNGERSELPGASATAIIPEGAPYQLPPPNYPESLLFTPVAATPIGQYWSPYQDGGQYGGGDLLGWTVQASCDAWNGFPWCQSTGQP